MKKLMQFLLLFCAVPIAVFGAASGQPAFTNANSGASLKGSDASEGPLIATGKGVSVTRSQLDQVITAVKADAAVQGQAIPPERIKLIERQILDELISRQLVMNKATEADKVKGKVEFQKWFHQVKTNENLTDEQFEKKLAPQLLISGVTRDQWEKQKLEQYTIPFVLEREMKIDITDDLAKKYYDDTPAQFETPEMAHIAHILLSTRDLKTGAELSADQKAEKKKRAEDILKRARAGEDFAKLAKENSDDPAAKDSAGEITFPRGNPRVPPEFEAAAFSLNTNQISDIVTTPFGYHIIKLYEKMPAKKEPYNGLETKTVIVKNDGQRATLKEVFTDQAIRKQGADFMKQLRNEADVKILDESLKPTEGATSAGTAGTPSTTGTSTNK